MFLDRGGNRGELSEISRLLDRDGNRGQLSEISPLSGQMWQQRRVFRNKSTFWTEVAIETCFQNKPTQQDKDNVLRVAVPAFVFRIE